jgi:hypothetical protein
MRKAVLRKTENDNTVRLVRDSVWDNARA